MLNVVEAGRLVCYRASRVNFNLKRSILKGFKRHQHFLLNDPVRCRKETVGNKKTDGNTANKPNQKNLSRQSRHARVSISRRCQILILIRPGQGLEML